MKKLLLLITFLIFSCDENQQLTIPSIQNSTFSAYSYVIDTPVDLNEDGIYSYDIFKELDLQGFCPIDFDTELAGPFDCFNVIYLYVYEDENGNLRQGESGGTSDGPHIPFRQQDNLVFFGSDEKPWMIAELSDNGSEMVFVIPNENLFMWHNRQPNILNSDGTTSNYEGDLIITYVRE